MDLLIYKTNTENSFLQAIGPYRINVTDESFLGFNLSEEIEFNEQLLVGELENFGKQLVYGENIDLDHSNDTN